MDKHMTKEQLQEAATRAANSIDADYDVAMYFYDKIRGRLDKKGKYYKAFVAHVAAIIAKEFDQWSLKE